MDTPIIAQYYKETEPEKRKALLDQAFASGEDMEANEIRREIWEARYKGNTNDGGVADGYLKFWMALEFNRNAGHRVFGAGRAQKEIRRELDDVKFREIQNKSPMHEALLYRECRHLVRFYMALCEKDKNYNTVLCGLVTIKKDSAKAKLQRDIYETAIRLPQDLGLQEDLALVSKAAREVFEEQFPGERLPE
ncbi:DUF6553 family protein [Blautia sp. MSJ-19]|uniref:DUF6553 family protein n=1 Tax=Blautia sp. MSJ-19 TaxID=2841517 RepID=UPI001C0EBB6A|nr:DUF6553 family protein [Blautia sp. MSJ-19]MBU5481869.1 hypothetical protein [Blautia sp. MSJ-19]